MDVDLRAHEVHSLGFKVWKSHHRVGLGGESTSSAGRRMVSDIRVKRSSVKALTEANSSLASTSRPALLKRSSSCRGARACGSRKWLTDPFKVCAERAVD